MAVSAEELKEIFKRGEFYSPFECAKCELQGNFISGPHSHACSVCGAEAIYGWYTTPMCREHQRAIVNG